MSKNRIPSLDGLRAIAFGLVFVAHSGLNHIIPGGFGVTVFFVLSGFLITTLLRAEFTKNGRIAITHFYWRRALRILPPLYITLVVTVLLHWLVGQPWPVSGMAVTSFAAFFGNYYTALTDFAGTPAGAGVFWSLAIEEHYYLLFPPLALWLLRRNDPGLTLRVIAAIAALVLAWRLVLWFHFEVSAVYLYSATESRADALLFGSLLALVKNPWLDAPPAPNAARDWGLLLGAGGVLLLTFLVRDETFRATLRYTLQGLALLPLFWLAVARPQWWLMRWLEHPWLIEIGALSYALYLVHHSIIESINHLVPGLSPPVLMFAAFIPSLAYALLLRRYVETPLARLRPR